MPGDPSAVHFRAMSSGARGRSKGGRRPPTAFTSPTAPTAPTAPRRTRAARAESPRASYKRKRSTTPRRARAARVESPPRRAREARAAHRSEPADLRQPEAHAPRQERARSSGLRRVKSERVKSEEPPSPPRHRARRDAATPAERRPRLLEIGGVVYERDRTKMIIECNGKRYKPVKRVGAMVPDARTRAYDGPYVSSPSLPQSPNAARGDPGPHAGELGQYSRSPSEDASVQERDWAHHQPLTPPRRAPQTSPHALSSKSKAGPPMRKQATPYRGEGHLAHRAAAAPAAVDPAATIGAAARVDGAQRCRTRRSAAHVAKRRDHRCGPGHLDGGASYWQ